MKYFAMILCICLLLAGCAAPATPAGTTDAPIADTEPPLYIIDPTASSPEDVTIPEIPTGTDSTGPAPEIGPEGLPTPAL